MDARYLRAPHTAACIAFDRCEHGEQLGDRLRARAAASVERLEALDASRGLTYEEEQLLGQARRMLAPARPRPRRRPAAR